MPSTKELFPSYPHQNEWGSISGGSKFGNSDLDMLLKDAVGGEYKWDDQQRLRDARDNILRWLRSDNGKDNTAAQNRPDAAGGLYERLSGTEITPWWGSHADDQPGDTEGRGEERKIQFGGADLRVALAMGHSKAKITETLNSNRGWLGTSNKAISQGGVPHGIYTWLVGEEASKNWGTVTPPTPGTIGTGEDKDGIARFGNVEYFNKLKELWDQTGDASKLHEYRDYVLDYLKNHVGDEVHPDNRPPKADGTGGKPTGMWQQITDHKRTGHLNADNPAVREGDWHENQIKITPWFGGPDPEGTDPTSIQSERSQFTEADWLAAKAGGHTDFDVYRHLRANPTQYKGEASKQTYDFVRQGLINRAPMYAFEDNSAERQGNWRGVLENPIWQEVGFYLSSKAGTAGIPSKYDDYRWHDKEDYDVIEDYIRDNYKPEGWEDMDTSDRVASFRTDEALTSIIGSQGQGVGQAGWEAGEYWAQWGASGPPDRDQDDGKDASDLTWIQKMVAQAGLEAADMSDWRDRLEIVETKFLGELYGPGKGYEDAPDEWGLDIMRVDLDGPAFTKAWSTANEELSQEWYETLTKGEIDWAFYQDSAVYQKAKSELGLVGKYTAEDLGVAGIRQANVWVHGQNTVMPIADDEILKSWKEYKAKPLPAPYKPKDLTITGYTPDKKRGLATVPENPLAPTINIPKVDIKRPSNLKPKIGKIVGE